MPTDLLSLDDWLRNPGDTAHFRSGPLWRMTAYRLGLYSIDAAWHDLSLLDRYRILRPACSQLYRAIGSIPANIADGYGRSSGRDRVRFYEYALCSNREAEVWYYSVRKKLPPGIIDARLEILGQISRLLSTIIPADRDKIIRKQL